MSFVDTVARGDEVASSTSLGDRASPLALQRQQLTIAHQQLAIVHQQLASDCTNNNNNKPKSRWFYRCEQETAPTLIGDGGGDESTDDSGDGSPSMTMVAAAANFVGVDFGGRGVAGCGNSATSSSSLSGQSPLNVSQDSLQAIDKRLQGACQMLETSGLADLPFFERIDDNIYLNANKKKDKKIKHPSRMICECSYEDAVKSGKGCDDECLNRLLYYECGPNCPSGSLCTNIRFQKHQYSNVEAFPAGNKGFGLRALEDMAKGTFIMEYVGEVLTAGQFKQRSKSYAKDPKHKHHYFMALKNDEVIDATRRGNISRFINHSCDPNSETQKWTVNGHLRIGFFTIKDVKSGEELTFDYKFQRYGKEAQKCLCGASNCRGYIGDKKSEKDDQKKRDKEQKNIFEDQLFDLEFDDILLGGCLKNRDQVVTFGRLMLRADDYESRCSLLDLLMNTSPHILRLFVDLHGCALLWSWMVDDVVSGDQWRHFQLLVLNTLDTLPIPYKDILVDSRLLPVVERWLRTPIDKTADSAPHNEDTGRVVKKVLFDVISSVCMGTSYNIDRYDASPVIDYATQIKQKCEALLSKWSLLKENFKIPKKLEKSRSNNGSSPSDNESKNKIVKVPEKRPNPPKVTYSLYPANQNNDYTLMNNGLKGRLINSYSTDQYKRALKRPLANSTEGDPISKRIKEEQRREFEAKIALQEERKLLERQRQVKEAEDEAARIAAQVLAAVSYKNGGSTASAATPSLPSNSNNNVTPLDDAEVRRLSAALLPLSSAATATPTSTPAFFADATPTSFGGGGAWTTPTVTTSSYDDGGAAATSRPVGTPDSSALQGAIPADLVHDPSTAQYWWMDRSSGVFVYPATDEQIIAFQLGDIASIPHFYHDPSTDLIHEVQVRMPLPVSQATMAPHVWPGFCDSQQSDLNFSASNENTLSQQTTSSERSKRDARISALKNDIADLQKQLECKQAELKQLVDQAIREDDNSDKSTSLEEAIPIQSISSVRKLPKNWRMARDTDGKPYYYHIKTKKTQWEIPMANISDDDEIKSLGDRRRLESRRRQPPRPMAKKAAIASSSLAATAKRRRQRLEELRREKQAQKAKAALKLWRLANRLNRSRVGSVSGAESDSGAGPGAKIVHEQLSDREDGEISPEDDDVIDPATAPANRTVDDPVLEDYDDDEDDFESSERSASLEESPDDQDDEDETEERADDVVDISDGPAAKIYRQSEMCQIESPKPSKAAPCVTTTAAADTSSEVAKKFKEAFKARISNHIIKCLNPYRKPDCKFGHITCHDDFKHLARKLTHAIMEKELKQCHGFEELKITDSVLYKAKDYIKRYMHKLGPVYKRSSLTDD